MDEFNQYFEESLELLFSMGKEKAIYELYCHLTESEKTLVMQVMLLRYWNYLKYN